MSWQVGEGEMIVVKKSGLVFMTVIQIDDTKSVSYCY